MSVSEVLEPTPQRPLKRRFAEDLDPELQEAKFKEPAPKRRREELPVLDWLSNVPAPPPEALTEILRSRSVPANFNDNQIPPTVQDLRGHSKSLLAIDEMGDHGRRERGDDDSFSQRTNKSTITRIKPASARYRTTVLEGNDVVIDAMGSQMLPAVKDLLNTTILKKRTSPPLSQDMVDSTVTSMMNWANSTENVVNGFVSSAMFPVQQPGISLGGNSRWSRAALPYDKDYGYPISTPKPDFHVGYTPGIKSGFSKQQRHVIDHPYASPYTQPGIGNILPFLTVEIKSEATGGTLYHAENQAAGSGTYCQNSMEWLLDQAKASQKTKQTDAIAFSISATGRLVELSVHWRSPDDRIYYMSRVKGFQTLEKGHVQACHDTVKNIVEWGLGTRHSQLGDVLQQLFPLSQQWSEKRTATAAELDDPDNDEEEEEVIEVRTKRAAKSIRSEPSRGSRRPSVATQSFTNTQSVRDKRSTTTKDTSVTKGSKQSKSLRR
ncbi:MAG: hypothetical protein LQ340_000195 [Diploschistes diacapsis]|nr:MAG: hypothetical protein LQ340_000195 [Diploschistes diacapsis]